MDTTILANALIPIASMVDRHSMTETYRAVEIQPEIIRACCPYALAEVAIPTGLTGEGAVYVDGQAFCSIVSSLPAKQDFKIVLKGPKLVWQCGNAKGELALMALRQPLPELSVGPVPRRKPEDGLSPTSTFIDALELGGLSCAGASLNSMGMNGIVLDIENSMACSSDNVAISLSMSDEWGIAGSGRVTLSKQGADLLGRALRAGTGAIRFTDRVVSYVRPGLALEVALAQPLRHDLIGSAMHFGGVGQMVVTLPKQVLSSFIKRATSLAEKRRDTTVKLSAQAGRMELQFTEGEAKADEYFLADSLEVPGTLEAYLNAGVIARALAHVECVTIDHIERGVLIFHDTAGKFFYYVMSVSKE